MTKNDILSILAQAPTGVLCNADKRVQALGSSISPLFFGASVCGTAKTTKVNVGQNAGIHRALHTARKGDVLVVDTGGDRNFGYFGDILAACCRYRGIGGIVIDGSVRDRAELTEMNFPVFCNGINPSPTTKADPGEIDIDVQCGEQRISPGDIIVGDDDGVVVFPQNIAEDIAKSVQSVLKNEQRIKSLIKEGQTTCEIFKIPTP